MKIVLLMGVLLSSSGAFAAVYGSSMPANQVDLPGVMKPEIPETGCPIIHEANVLINSGMNKATALAMAQQMYTSGQLPSNHGK